MKNKIILTALALVSFLSKDLKADESAWAENVQVGWLDGKDTRVEGNIATIDTIKGVLELKVVEYDAEKDRYLVECTKFDGVTLPEPETFE